MARDGTVRVSLTGGGPLDGRDVDVPTSWKAYRPQKAHGAYVPDKAGSARWVWTPDPELK